MNYCVACNTHTLLPSPFSPLPPCFLPPLTFLLFPLLSCLTHSYLLPFSSYLASPMPPPLSPSLPLPLSLPPFLPLPLSLSPAPSLPPSLPPSLCLSLSCLGHHRAMCIDSWDSNLSTDSHTVA